MSNILITDYDIKKYTGVSGLETAEFMRSAIGISIAVQRTLTMWGVGAASVAGGSHVTVSGSAATTALGAKLMFATGLLALAGSVINIFISMGLPVAQAKQVVRERQFKSGFAYGYVIGLFDYGKDKLSTYRNGSPSPGFAPSYMTGVAQQAYNTGLLIGFTSAFKSTAKERASTRDALTQVLIAQCKANGTKLYMDNWTDGMWVEKYTVPFAKML